MVRRLRSVSILYVAAWAAMLVAVEPSVSGDVVIANDLVVVEISVSDGAIRSMRLPDMRPIALPSWLAEAESPTDTAQGEAVAVLGAFNPRPAIRRPDGHVEEMTFHSWLAGLPSDTLWQLAAQTADAVTLRRESDDLLEFLHWSLQEDRPTVRVRYWAMNRGDEQLDLVYVVRDAQGTILSEQRPYLVALNGIHHDLGQIDARYAGWFAYQQDQEDMVTVKPAQTQSQPLDMRAHRWLAQRSRFFASFWSHRAARLFSLPEATVPAVADLLAQADQASSGAVRELAPMATVYPYEAGKGRHRQQQGVTAITYWRHDQSALGLQRFDSLAARTGAYLAWDVTVTGLTSNHLERLGEDEREIEFTSAFYRFFRVLSSFMTTLLGGIYSVFAVIGLASVGYGLAVIVLTLLIKLALHRLNYKAQKSMLTMQKIGPEMQRLKAQYGHDRQVFAQKQMELFRKHQVNPLGGCLPMLLQLPIFFALYSAFSQAAELRGQSFLWIADLTMPDYTFNLGFALPWWGQVTINILPLCYIGVALWMGLTQKPPAAGDKTQQDMAKMMRFMPVMFGFIFYSMPAGLVLYFTVSMALSVIENRYVRRKLGMA